MAISPISASLLPAGPSSPQFSPADSRQETSSFLGSFNPLHHIPVVSAVYGHMTETSAVPAVRILVGAALAGPVGFIAALVDALCEEATGRTVGGHAVAALIGGPEKALAARDIGTINLGLHESNAGAVDRKHRLTSVSLGEPYRLQAGRAQPEVKTTRELARTYLLDLALRHPLKPMADDGEIADA